MNVYEALLGIVQVPSYIPGGAWSFSKFISLLLWIVGFPIARKDKRGVDLISDALPFRRLWYGEPDAAANAIGYAKFRSRSHDGASLANALLRICLCTHSICTPNTKHGMEEICLG